MPEFDYVDEESGAPAGDVPVVDSRATIGRAAGFRDAAAIVTGAIPDLADSVLSSVTKLTPLPDFERGSLTRQVPFAKENLKAAEAASGRAQRRPIRSIAHVRRKRKMRRGPR